jgi:proliferating cell nuclear antigen (pcna)|uniref:DNA polymerase sliding clamp n=1 Tax=Ignisphaera aggregans TaxID=334771 RepID=A0A7J2TAA6_9CREN
MSAKLTYPVGSVLKNVSQVLKRIVDQVPIVMSLDQFSIEAFSPDKVSMIVVVIPSTAFEEYDLSGEVSMVADRNELARALRRATKRDKVTLEYVEGTRELKVKVFNVRANLEREYSVALSEVGFERVGEIDIQLEVSASIPSSELVSIIKDADVVSEEVTLMYSSDLNGIKVLAHGDIGSYETILRQFQPLTYLESSTSNVIARYSVEHLKAIARLLDLAEECNISFGSDKPLKISFDLSGGGKVTVWIAPRS